jgi:hypothetical protein
MSTLVEARPPEKNKQDQQYIFFCLKPANQLIFLWFSLIFEVTIVVKFFNPSVNLASSFRNNLKKLNYWIVQVSFVITF